MTSRTVALLSSLVALTVSGGGCVGTADIRLEEVEGTYGPVRLKNEIDLAATLFSPTGHSHVGTIDASLLSDLNPLVGQAWDTATISATDSGGVVFTRNPGQSDAAAFSISASKLRFGGDSIDARTQLGQTLSTPVSNGCELVSGQYLDLSMRRSSFSASLVVSSYFNDISPEGSDRVVTCDQLRAQFQADIRSARITADNQLIGVFVANQVITDAQVLDIFSLDVSAGFYASKSSSEVAPSGRSSESDDVLADADASAALRSMHASLVKSLSAAKASQ